MSIENVKKLELGMDMSCNCEKFIDKRETLTSVRIQQLIDRGIDLEEEAMQSGDIDVLERAVDYFFDEENDEALMCGICESLENDVFQHLTYDQILCVLKTKMSKLIETNVIRAKHFAGACISHGFVKELNEILLAVEDKHLRNKLILEIDKWIGDDYPEEVAILKQK